MPKTFALRLADFFWLLVESDMPNVFNPWWDSDPLDTGDQPAVERRYRLRKHLNHQPRLILIGEAPGYQGCHFSGVPFTNERLLLDGLIPRVTIPGRITSRALPWCEPSATIVWKLLHSLGIAADVALWNAFAWHPHRPGEPMSNRTPTRLELVTGLPVLRAFLELYPGVPVVAVGQKAASVLGHLGVAPAASVRHPAMGGAAAFRAGLGKLVEGMGT